jgi:hypothetical protein
MTPKIQAKRWQKLVSYIFFNIFQVSWTKLQVCEDAPGPTWRPRDRSADCSEKIPAISWLVKTKQTLCDHATCLKNEWDLSSDCRNIADETWGHVTTEQSVVGWATLLCLPMVMQSWGHGNNRKQQQGKTYSLINEKISLYHNYNQNLSDCRCRGPPLTWGIGWGSSWAWRLPGMASFVHKQTEPSRDHLIEKK